MTEQVYGSFEDFYKVLDGTDNINTADIQGGYPARHNFMKQLLEKSDLAETVLLSAPDRVQAGARAKNGRIEIEVIGHRSENGTFTQTDNNKPYSEQPKTNSVAKFTIHRRFGVTKRFRDYDPEIR
jgi:hypothetical protein